MQYQLIRLCRECRCGRLSSSGCNWLGRHWMRALSVCRRPSQHAMRHCIELLSASGRQPGCQRQPGVGPHQRHPLVLRAFLLTGTTLSTSRGSKTPWTGSDCTILLLRVKPRTLHAPLGVTYDAVAELAISDSMLCAHLWHCVLVWHFCAVNQMKTLCRLRCRRAGPQQGSGGVQRPHAVGRWQSQRRAGALLSSSICLSPAPAHAGRPRNALRCNTAQQLAAKGDAWWL